MNVRIMFIVDFLRVILTYDAKELFVLYLRFNYCIVYTDLNECEV